MGEIDVFDDKKYTNVSAVGTRFGLDVDVQDGARPLCRLQALQGRLRLDPTCSSGMQVDFCGVFQDLLSFC